MTHHATHPAAADQTALRGLPLLGLLPRMRKDPLHFYGEMARTCGDIAPFHLGPERLFFVNHPDHVTHVFQDNRDNYVKSHHYDRMRFILGEGLFTSEGEEWSRQRRTAQPAFSGPNLKHMFDVMRAATDDLVAKWQGCAERGEEIDLLAEAMKAALDIALRAMFTTPLTSQATRIYDALNVILPELEKRVWAIVPFAAYLPGPRKWAAEGAVREVHAVVEEVIRARMDVVGGTLTDAAPENDDLLSRFIKGEQERGWDGDSIRRLREQCVVFLIAGHETTATTLTWTWYTLSKYPLADRRLFKETVDALGDRPVGWSDIGNLHYARMVFEETLRLYPPGWMLTRDALADDVIGGLTVPKGSTVVLCAHSLHRHPDYWDNPEGFDPSRFAPGMEKDRHPGVYFPFGGGKRVCIGKRMALIEAELILSEIARRWRLELSPGQKIEPKAMITIRPGDTVRMRLRPRGEAARQGGAEGMAEVA